MDKQVVYRSTHCLLRTWTWHTRVGLQRMKTFGSRCLWWSWGDFASGIGVGRGLRLATEMLAMFGDRDSNWLMLASRDKLGGARLATGFAQCAARPRRLTPFQPKSTSS